ncbi:MAG TPA: hypothetical protein VF328_06765 [Mycobacterium sp.]
MLSAHGDAHWRHQLDVHEHVVDSLLARYGGRRTNHTGDGIFALFEAQLTQFAARWNLSVLLPFGAFQSVQAFMSANANAAVTNGAEWPSTSAPASPGWPRPVRVLTSHTVRDLCAGSEVAFEDLGPHHLKGVPEDASIYMAMNPH